MTRINTNVQNLVAKRTLDANNMSLTTALNRLSTGLRINTGKDDPAGLIASEGLRASKVAITGAYPNADSVRYDATAPEYRIAIDGLVAKQAAP